MEWISVEKMKPYRHDMYNVAIRLADGRVVSSFGYWGGEDWERVHEASEYQSFEPSFEYYDMEVLFWSPDLEPPK